MKVLLDMKIIWYEKRMVFNISEQETRDSDTLMSLIY
jgi:hypothetical protein